MCAKMPMFECVCVAEVLIFFVSGAQMQCASSSTSPDSAVCAGLREAGVGGKWGYILGVGGGGCRRLCYYFDGEGKGDNTQQIS